MCGIFGIIGQGSNDDVRLELAARSLRHRGPDSHEIVQLPGVSLGHTLLSIIGSSPITQPIRSSDGRGILTYNGEIYNYLELLRNNPDLLAACQGRPATDTVVLVEGLRLYGEEFLEQLNGMFAFCYHDLNSGQTLLVRDRLGIKPLFYSATGTGTIFASETQAVRVLSGKAFAPSPEGFYSYVRFRYPLGDRSFDLNIRQLRPGHLLRIGANGKVQTVRWWVNDGSGEFTGTYEQAVDTVRELLESSIELRMRSNHGFCTFLSGGLDSSLLTALASVNKEHLDTYSVGIAGDSKFDESAYAAAVAAKLGTYHHSYSLGIEDYRLHHAAFVGALKEPLPVPNQVALRALSQDVSRTHRVVLSGEGADEVFAGYGQIFLLPHDWDVMQDRRGKPGSLATKLLQRYGPELPVSFDELFIRRYGYTTHQVATEVLKPLFGDINYAVLRDSVESDILEIAEALNAEDPFNRMLLLFQNVHLPGLLYRVDGATMAHSVEARVPFLDHRLVEFANTLPIDMKIRTLKPRSELRHLLSNEISEVHDVPKAILKEIGRDLLPEGIADRKKMGFPIPPAFYAPQSSSVMADYQAWTERNIELWATSI
jgi:asparagine synthase (glutamine-hydrolysing)